MRVGIRAAEIFRHFCSIAALHARWRVLQGSTVRVCQSGERVLSSTLHGKFARHVNYSLTSFPADYMTALSEMCIRGERNASAALGVRVRGWRIFRRQPLHGLCMTGRA
jgi:hypothetical protein